MAMKVITRSLPRAYVGEPYSARLDVVDGVEPYTWALDGASDPLPTGLTLNADGTITGTPTAAPDTYTNLIFEATDGVPSTATTNPLSIEVEPGVYKRAGAYLMEPNVNETIDRVQGDGDQVSRFEFMRHFHRSRDVASGEPDYLQALQFLHDGSDLQATALPSGFTAGQSINAALIYLDGLITTIDPPFTVLPDPSGDTTGATDAAALNAVWGDASTKEWLVIPPSCDAANPYYIDADITNGGIKGFMLTAANVKQDFHFLDSISSPHTPGTPREIREINQMHGVGMGLGVRPMPFSTMIEIVNSVVEIEQYDLLPGDIGYIRESEIRIADETARISSAASQVSLFENDILFTGSANNAQNALTMGAVANSTVRISSNWINGDLGGSATIFDFSAGVATALVAVGPNTFRDTTGTGTYTAVNTAGFAGGTAVSPQATI